MPRVTAIERIPSCTTPTFSKIAVMFIATQPAMPLICQASGNAVPTVAIDTRPARHARIASDAVPTTMQALMQASVSVHPVVMRSCRWNAAVWSSTASRTNASSSRARANSLTVTMLV